MLRSWRFPSWLESVGYFSAGCFSGLFISYFLTRKKPQQIEYEGEAKFVLQRQRGLESCSMHVLRKKACSQDCRYTFLLWLVNCIDGATQYVDVAIYFLNEECLADAFIRAKQRGVRVRLISSYLDDETGLMATTMAQIRRAHIAVRSMKTPDSQLMHLKLILIDRKSVLIGSANFTKSAFLSNSEECLRLTHPSVVSGLSRYFQDTWDAMTEHDEFLTRIRNLSRETLKAQSKSARREVSDGVW